VTSDAFRRFLAAAVSRALRAQGSNFAVGSGVAFHCASLEVNGAANAVPWAGGGGTQNTSLEGSVESVSPPRSAWRDGIRDNRRHPALYRLQWRALYRVRIGVMHGQSRPSKDSRFRRPAPTSHAASIDVRDELWSLLLNVGLRAHAFSAVTRRYDRTSDPAAQHHISWTPSFSSRYPIPVRNRSHYKRASGAGSGHCPQIPLKTPLFTARVEIRSIVKSTCGPIETRQRKYARRICAV